MTSQIENCERCNHVSKFSFTDADRSITEVFRCCHPDLYVLDAYTEVRNFIGFQPTTPYWCSLKWKLMNYFRTENEIRERWSTAKQFEKEQMREFVLHNEHLYNLCWFFLCELQTLNGMSFRVTCGLSIKSEDGGITIEQLRQIIDGTKRSPPRSYPQKLSHPRQEISVDKITDKLIDASKSPRSVGPRCRVRGRIVPIKGE